ncbi:M28 family peptidase [Candidatus Cardinium hertigii]|uniref:M28 family peptidase n=1 Tax=Candidatus Cardinium hertigii TaxID=247481 RepID=UPI003D7E3112
MTIFNIYRIYQLYIAILCIGCSNITLGTLPTASGPSAPIPIYIGAATKHITRQSDESLKKNLKKHITFLSQTIGPRNISDPAYYQKLCEAAQYIDHAFKEIGYQTNIIPYSATYRGQKFHVQNIEVVIPAGIPASNGIAIKNSTHTECIVIGAHYDTVCFSPGADDNGSGIAALIEIARHLYDLSMQLEDKTMIKRTIKLVAFPNEEWPYSADDQTGKHFGYNMGSVQYAKQAKEKGEVITGMISLESIGYFSNQPNSQKYPWYLKWLKYFYGDRGDFLVMVGDLSSQPFQKKWRSCYEQIDGDTGTIHGIALPGWIPHIYRSDHGAFSLEGFPAFMITDTADFRNPHYHEATDHIGTINFTLFTKATKNLIATITCLALDGPLKT